MFCDSQEGRRTNREASEQRDRVEAIKKSVVVLKWKVLAGILSTGYPEEMSRQGSEAKAVVTL